jgi:hypothetical protein
VLPGSGTYATGSPRQIELGVRGRFGGGVPKRPFGFAAAHLARHAPHSGPQSYACTLRALLEPLVVCPVAVEFSRFRMSS